MNKEVIIAIIIGVGLGLGGALYFSNSGTPTKKEIKTLAINSVQVTPKLNVGEGSLAAFTDLPAQGSLLTNGTLRIAGKGSDDSVIVAANRVQIVPIKVKNGEFALDFRLKPGVNELVLYDGVKNKEQLKVLRLYYLELAKSEPDKEEATKEADILKAKLEAKVLELRNKPKKVISGEIKSISDKVLTINEMNTPVKVTVEPEITNFADVDGNSLSEIAFDDITKGDTVTAFISDIGGEEISYTVYREPAVTVAAGKVSNIDNKAYKLTIVDFDKSSFGADIETSTDQYMYSKKTKVTSEAGFSKLAIGQRIFARLTGTKDDYSIAEYLIIN